LFYKNLYKYDKHNNLISDIHFSKKNNTLEQTITKEYKYDSLNRLIQSKHIFSKTNFTTTNYSYYNNGLLKSESGLSEYSKKAVWSEYIYDKNENLKKVQEYYISDKEKKKKGRYYVIKYEFYKYSDCF